MNRSTRILVSNQGALCDMHKWSIDKKGEVGDAILDRQTLGRRVNLCLCNIISNPTLFPYEILSIGLLITVV